MLKSALSVFQCLNETEKLLTAGKNSNKLRMVVKQLCEHLRKQNKPQQQQKKNYEKHFDT